MVGASQAGKIYTALPCCLEQEAFLGSWSNIFSCADLDGPCNQTCGELSGLVLYLLLWQEGLRCLTEGWVTKQVWKKSCPEEVSGNGMWHYSAALAQSISRPLAEGGKRYWQGWDEDGACPLRQHHAWESSGLWSWSPVSSPTASISFRLPVHHHTLLLAVLNATVNMVFLLQAVSKREF